MWDPRVDVRNNPRHLKNYLWAMTVMCPPDAPPGVAIAEFRTAREALNAEKMCRRYRPQPIEVEWLTTRPTTNQPPPSTYFDSNERHYQALWVFIKAVVRSFLYKSFIFQSIIFVKSHL